MRPLHRTLPAVTLLVLASLLAASCGAPQTPPSAQAPQASQAPQTVRETVIVEQTVRETVVVEQQVVVTPTSAPAPQAVTDIPPRPDGTPAPPEKQVFRFDLPSDFWPDPISLGNWYGEWNVLTSAGLTTEGPDGQIQPELAERWESSADGRTWTFFLKQDAKFSDGSPITMDDVTFSLISFLDPRGISEGLYRAPFQDIEGYQAFIDGTATEISGIKAVDASTLTFTLTRPIVYFPKALGFWTARIVSKKNVTEGGQEWWRTPVTSGMYKVGTFEYGQRNYLELVPNEYYTLGPKPKLQKIIIERVTDPSTRLTRYLNNETDALYYPEPADVAAALRGGELKDDLLGNVIGGYFFFYFRHDRPPFDDPKVRQAFIMATDQDRLARTVLEGTLVKAPSLMPRGAECYPTSDNSVPFDPARARELLAESTYAGQMPLVRIQVSEVSGIPVVGRWTRVATAMADMWQENLGISVQLQTKEFEFEDSQDGAAQIFRSSRSPLVLDPGVMTLQFDNGKGIADQAKYVNPDVQQMLVAADGEQDATKRCEMYQQADKTLFEDGIVAGTWGISNWAFAKPYVRGISTANRWQFYLSMPQTYIAEP